MLVVQASRIRKFPLETRKAPYCVVDAGGCTSVACPKISLTNMDGPTLCVDAGGCTSVVCPTIYLTNTEIGTACGSKCFSEAADAMASNEDSVRQERLRRRNQGL